MSRLWRTVIPLSVLMVALATGGCSFKLDSVTASSKDDDAALTTGSIKTVSTTTTIDGLPKGRDLLLTHAAVRDALSRGGKDISLPWENPQTGARGTVTPLKAAYNQDGQTCQDFLASYVREGAESWMQGEACRAGKGTWEVRTLTAWRRS